MRCPLSLETFRRDERSLARLGPAGVIAVDLALALGNHWGGYGVFSSLQGMTQGLLGDVVADAASRLRGTAYGFQSAERTGMLWPAHWPAWCGIATAPRLPLSPAWLSARWRYWSWCSGEEMQSGCEQGRLRAPLEPTLQARHD